MTTIIRCPGCNQFRRPGPTCPTCETRRQQRRLRRRRIATFAITLTLIALLGALLLTLAACSSQPTTSTTPQLHRQTLSEIRANIISTPRSNDFSRSPQSTLTPFTLPAGQLYAIDPVYCQDGQFEGAPYAYCDNRRY